MSTTIFNNPDLNNIKIKDLFNIDMFIEIIKVLSLEQQKTILQLNENNEKLNSQNLMIETLKKENKKNIEDIDELIKNQVESKKNNDLIMMNINEINEELKT